MLKFGMRDLTRRSINQDLEVFFFSKDLHIIKVSHGIVR